MQEVVVIVGQNIEKNNWNEISKKDRVKLIVLRNKIEKKER